MRRRRKGVAARSADRWRGDGSQPILTHSEYLSQYPNPLRKHPRAGRVRWRERAQNPPGTPPGHGGLSGTVPGPHIPCSPKDEGAQSQAERLGRPDLASRYPPPEEPPTSADRRIPRHLGRAEVSRISAHNPTAVVSPNAADRVTGGPRISQTD